MSATSAATKGFRRLQERFLPANASPEGELRVRAGAVLVLCGLPLALAWIAARIVDSNGPGAVGWRLELVCLVSAALLPVLSWWRRSLAWMVHGWALLGFGLVCVSTWRAGGPGASSAPFWLLPIPALMLTLVGRAHARVWLGASLLACGAFLGLELGGLLPRAVGGAAALGGGADWTLVGVTLLLVLCGWTHERAKILGRVRLDDTRRALARVRERVTSLHQSRCSLIARISLELRGPLTGVLTAADGLRSDAGAEPPALAAILRSGGRLLSALDDLRDLAEIEAGTLELRHLRCSPRTLAEEVVSALEAKTPSEELRLEVEAARDLPETIETDPARMKQILVKLVSGALQIVERGTLRLRVGLDEAGAQVVFELSASEGDLRSTQLAKQLRARESAEGRRDAAAASVGPSIVCGLTALLGGHVGLYETGEGAALRVALPRRSLRWMRPDPASPGLTPVGPVLDPGVGRGGPRTQRGVAAWLDERVRHIVPTSLYADPELLGRARLCVGFTLAASVALVALVGGLALGSGASVLVSGVALLAAIASSLAAVPVLLRATGSLALASNALLVGVALGVAGGCAYAGNAGGAVSFVAVLLPMSAVALAGGVWGVPWTGLVLAGAAAFAWMERPAGALAPEHVSLIASGTLAALLGAVHAVAGLHAQTTHGTFAGLERMREELERSRAEVERAERARSDVLLPISHELRTPLTSILGFADVLIEEAGGDELRLRRLHEIRRNGRRMLATIDGWTDLAQLESGRLELKHERFAPPDLLLRVLDRCEGCSEPGLDVEGSLQAPLPEWAEADAGRIESILVSFVEGVVALVREGALDVVASVESGSEPDAPSWIVLRVERREARGASSPSERASPRVGRATPHDDFHLELCRRLAERMGGRVEIQGLEERGATACLFLPVDLPAEDALAHLAEVSSGEISAVRGPELGQLGLRILVAEDGADNRRLIAHLLSRLGAEPTFVENGELALRRALFAEAEKRPFDVVLMDLQMPEVDGYEATRTLRDAGFDRPIIALTAHAAETERERCLREGFDAFAVKPMDRASLVAALIEAGTHGRYARRPGRDAA